MEEPEAVNESEKWSNYVNNYAASIRNNPDDDEHSIEVKIYIFFFKKIPPRLVAMFFFFFVSFDFSVKRFAQVRKARVFTEKR